jgi:hypothetical protein
VPHVYMGKDGGDPFASDKACKLTMSAVAGICSAALWGFSSSYVVHPHASSAIYAPYSPPVLFEWDEYNNLQRTESDPVGHFKLGGPLTAESAITTTQQSIKVPTEGGLCVLDWRSSTFGSEIKSISQRKRHLAALRAAPRPDEDMWARITQDVPTLMSDLTSLKGVLAEALQPAPHSEDDSGSGAQAVQDFGTPPASGVGLYAKDVHGAEIAFARGTH